MSKQKILVLLIALSFVFGAICLSVKAQSTGSLKITVKKANGCTATSVDIYYKRQSDSAWIGPQTESFSGTSVSYTVQDLPADTTYDARCEKSGYAFDPESGSATIEAGRTEKITFTMSNS